MSRTLRLGFAALLLAGIAGCSSPPPPQTFPPLNYSYLPPIVLKVATVNVINQYVPDPNAAQWIGQDPAPPPTVLQTELTRRLVGAGTPGTATVTIGAASIDSAGGNLVGAMTVRVDVASADGRHTGFTEATVSHTQTAPDSDASQNDTQAALYGMTKQLMDAMNVQLQYQIQHDLADWVIAGPAGGFGAAAGYGPAPTTGTIEAAPLAAPTAVTGTPLTGAPTPLVVPGTPTAPPVAPGQFLQLPPGVAVPPAPPTGPAVGAPAPLVPY